MLTNANTRRPHRTADLKAQALAALAGQSEPWVKLRVAAAAIGRHRATVYRWYASDPAFRAAVDRINDRNMKAHLERLEQQRAEEQARRAQNNARWLALRQRQATHARSCKRR